MKPAHTPGPWDVSREYILASHPGKTLHIAQVYDMTRFAGNTEANARLIAAAPDLLEACQQALFAIPTTHGAFETVRNAIAKATNPNAGAAQAYPAGRWTGGAK